MALVAGVEAAVRLHIARGDGVNDRDQDGLTPLMIAASSNKPEICEMLIAAGADPSLQDNYGRDALRIARIFGSSDAIAAMRGRIPGGAAASDDEEALDDDDSEGEEGAGGGAFDWAAQLARALPADAWARPKGRPVRPPVTQLGLRAHLARGDDIDARDGDGRTGLMIVAALDKPKMCKLFIEAGADPALRNRAGKNVLEIAKAHQASSAARVIEAALASQAAAGRPTPADSSASEEGGEEAPDAFGDWLPAPEVAAPESDGAILTRAIEIQRAIAEHVPLDSAADWSGLDLSEDAGASAHPASIAALDLADSGAWESRRATTWEDIRRRNEEAAKRKRAAEPGADAKAARADAPPPDPDPTWRREEASAAAFAAEPAPPPFAAAPKPQAAPALAMPPSALASKPLPLGAVLASAKRAGFHVDGKPGAGLVLVAIHAANDTKSRTLIRQLVEHGFEYRPGLGYCK